jgi:hypothetical protein
MRASLQRRSDGSLVRAVANTPPGGAAAALWGAEFRGGPGFDRRLARSTDNPGAPARAAGREQYHSQAVTA